MSKIFIPKYKVDTIQKLTLLLKRIQGSGKPSDISESNKKDGQNKKISIDDTPQKKLSGLVIEERLTSIFESLEQHFLKNYIQEIRESQLRVSEDFRKLINENNLLKEEIKKLKNKVE